MQPRTPKLLEDIRDAAAFIADATRDVAEADYSRNRMLRQSVERNFEIIGEALRRLAQHDPATAQSISGYTQIIAFRNILIHAYDQLGDSIVWGVVERDVPQLLAEVVALLAQTDDAKAEDDNASQ
jgi:uncharacterized protein with HEPN domain